MNRNFADIINAAKLVLIDFHIPLCESCLRLDPVLEQVKNCLGKRIWVIKVSVEKNKALAEKYQITKVPTLMLFRNGKALWRESDTLSTEAIISEIILNNN